MVLGICPDCIKIQKIYNDVVSDDPYPLIFVPDSFIPLPKIQLKDADDEAEIITRYDGYKQYDVQKVQIKEQLVAITWHPTVIQDWCMTEGENKSIKEMLQLNRKCIRQLF